MRKLTLPALLLAAALLVTLALSRSTPAAAPTGEVWLLDEEAMTEAMIKAQQAPTSRLIALDTATGKSREIYACQWCTQPYDAGDTLYLTRVEKAGTHPEGWQVYAARLVRIDRRTGQVTEGPVFARSGIAWGFHPVGLSPDGRYLLMETPENPIHAVENKLHEQRGIARYDLKAEQLLPERLSNEVGSQAYPAADDSRIFLCCWVQGHAHPVPGVTAIDPTDGSLMGTTTLPAASLEVHPTHVFPAGDGRRFYALRAGTDQWWTLDAVEGKVTSGQIATSLLPLPALPRALAKGPYDSARGDAIAHGDRIYSAVHLVHVNPMEQGQAPKVLKGGGIQVLTSSFRQVARLEPDTPYISLRLSPDGKVLYALAADTAEVWAFDAESLKRIGRWQVGGRPLKLY